MTRTWAAVSGTRVGSAHVRDGKGGQDAHLSWTDGDTAVVSVADGHGHFLHFRSATGASLATEIAVALLRDAAAGFDEADEVARLLQSELGPALVEEWRSRVWADIDAHPFTVVEQGLVGDRPEDLLLPYGTTLLAMAASPRVLAVLQVGDGDAVVVREDGDVFRPLPPDPDLDGTRTTSLCQPDPLASLRCTGLDVTAEGLALGYVATDGFGTPRVDHEGWWRQVGGELLEHARDQGYAYIGTKIETWLEEPAEYGGDDATLGVIGTGLG